MDYTIPKTDWEDSDLPTLEDINRMERNIEYLKVLLNGGE